jgi:hypothetical protein
LVNSGAEVLVPTSNYSSDPSITFPTSAQTYDPRVDKYASNWYIANSTWGAAPAAWLYAVSPTPNPPQDMTTGGSISTNSFYIPGPKGSVSNPTGQVQSVAELGLINTGSVVNNSASYPYGVPWRSVRLQQSKGENSPPDRALMDIFMAPLPAADTNSLAQPETNVLAGTLNPNAALYPFTTTDPNGSDASRPLPFQALIQDTTNFTGSITNSSATAALVSTNIATHVFAANGINYSGQPYYMYPSDLCEIAGVGDQGEEGEAALRQFIDATTVQGNVYRVYSLGQGIQQTPSGALIVQSERYEEAFLERYQGPGGIKFRVVFWREIPL